MIQQQFAELEDYVIAFPDSPYTPGLRQAMGDLYRSRGRYGKALEHWRTAWVQTRGFADGAGKKIADRSLAMRSRLLASLGRLEELTALAVEVGDRRLDAGPLSVIWRESLEAAAVMRVRPGISYRCGVLALNNVAEVLAGGRIAALMAVESPETGFSLAELGLLARQNGLPLRAALRESGSELVVPSVVHWRENHYAALTRSHGNAAEVVDPTFGFRQILQNAEIFVEASGFFLIPEDRLPTGWRWLTEVEAGTVFGKGYPYILDSRTDSPCPSSTQVEAAGSCVTCAEGAKSTTSPSRCCGMPTWSVSEPYLNLWVKDIPLTYQPNKGPKVQLELKLKQRATAPSTPCATTFGALWQSTWIANVDATFFLTYGVGNVVLHGRDGETHTYYIASGQSESGLGYFSHSKIRWVTSGGTTLGFDLVLPGGQEEHYRFRAGNLKQFFLKEIADARGQVVTLNYDTIADPEYPEVKLRTVVDADGNTFTLNYNNSTDPTLVTSVSSTVAGTAYLAYDDDIHLTDLTDTAGIKSELTYDGNGCPLTLKTPYGTTEFVVGDNESGFPVRTALITEADGSQQLYAYIYGAGPNVDPPTPSGTPIGTLDEGYSLSRNSFHWGRAQVPHLSTLTIGDITFADVNLARVRHWLMREGAEGNTPSHTISWEIAPSPDGTLQGQSTWYDYPDKSIPSVQGSQLLPGVIARVMPDSTTWYQYFTRNTLGQVTQSIEKWVAGGGAQYRTNTYTYAANGMDVVQHVGPDGAVEQWSYNAYHQPLYHTNALNEITSYTYNGNQQLATVTSPSGLVATYTYNATTAALEKIVESIFGTGFSTNTFARYLGQTQVRAGLNGVNVTNTATVTVSTDSRGLVVTNILDSLGRPWERRTSGLIELSHYELFPSQSYSDSTGGNLILDRTALVSVVGGTNYTTNTWTYDAVRRLAYEGDAAGTLTAWQYCDCGGPSQITRGYGLSLAETTTNAFNTVGWRTNVWFPGAGSVSHTYDPLGRVLTTTDALGSSTNLYDNLGRLIEVKNAFGTVESRTYDVEDRVTVMTDRNGVSTTNTYDALGRIQNRTLTGGVAERWFYTGNVRGPTSYTNQIGKETLWTYDAVGRKTNEVVVGVMTNRFVYNGAGDLTELYDGNQVGGANRTQWRYDAYGRVTAKVYANNQTNLTCAYDLLSRLTNRWAQATGNAKYAYDKRGSLTNLDYASSTDLKFQFDALGRTTNMIDAVGTTKYTYANGLLATEDGPWASDTVTYGHSNARLRSQMVILQPTGNAWTNTYGYDPSRRLTGVTSPAGTFGYRFTGPGTLMARLDHPGGFWITNTFDGRGRMTDTTLYDNTSTILNRHGYTLNHAHQRTTVTRTNYAASTYNGKVDYTYDNAGEVRTARAYDGSGTAVPSGNFDYGYDAGWNMLKRTNNTSVTTYTVNNLNQITNDGHGAWSYDGNGNITYRPTAGVVDLSLTYTYDDENQLKSAMSSNLWKLEFTYDARGRMRTRKDYTWSVSTWVFNAERRYVYDGMLIAQERSSGNNPLVTYTRGTDLSGSLEGAGGIGGLLSRGAHAGSPNYQLSSAAHYHADGNGNVTMLVGTGSPTIKAYYRYDPFGRTLASGGSLETANVMRFSSKPVMGGSELYYYGYRFYDPSSQRWLNRDPIRERGGINLYQFVQNGVPNHVDVYGKFTIGIGLSASVGALLGFEGAVGGYVGYDPSTGRFSVGTLFSPGVGLQTPTAGTSVFLQWTAARCVDDLKGFGAHLGASFTPGIAIGGDFLLQPKPGGMDPLGFQLNFGLRLSIPIPAESHYYGTYSVGPTF